MHAKWKQWLVATLVLTTTMTPYAYAKASTAPAFVDVTQADPSKQVAIQQAKELGLIAGDPTGAFRPTDTITREELAIFIGRALKLPTNSDGTFADVANSSYGSSYIQAMRAAGLMSGDEHNQFRPLQPLTREELATVLVRVLDGLQIKGGKAATTTDQTQISGWAQDYVEASLRLGLLKPSGDRFDPAGRVQRQDIVEVLLDLFQPQTQTATINKVDGDVITIDNVPYVATGNLKKLLSENNAAALTGAQINFHSMTRGINQLGELTIVKSGDAAHPVQLDLGGAKIDGPLKLAGEHLKVTGTAQINELVISNEKANVTIDPGVKVEQLTLPPNADPSRVIANYDQVVKQIGKVNGQEPPKPPVPSVPSVPSVPTTPTNHAPTVAHPFSNRTITIGDALLPIPLGDVFHDADSGDVLTLTADSTAPGVATVSVNAQNQLVITPLNAGTTKITLHANDHHNALVDTSFTLTVHAQTTTPTNTPPSVAHPINNQTYTMDETLTPIPLGDVFHDADADSLTLTADSSVEGVARVAINNLNQLVITRYNVGTTKITLHATDGHNDPVDSSFTLTLKMANTPPVVAQPLADQVITIGETVSPIALNNVFHDAEGDALTLTADSSTNGVATVQVDNQNQLIINPVNAGTTTVTFAARLNPA